MVVLTNHEKKSRMCTPVMDVARSRRSNFHRRTYPSNPRQSSVPAASIAAAVSPISHYAGASPPPSSRLPLVTDAMDGRLDSEQARRLELEQLRKYFVPPAAFDEMKENQHATQSGMNSTRLPGRALINKEGRVLLTVGPCPLVPTAVQGPSSLPIRGRYIATGRRRMITRSERLQKENDGLKASFAKVMMRLSRSMIERENLEEQLRQTEEELQKAVRERDFASRHHRTRGFTARTSLKRKIRDVDDEQEGRDTTRKLQRV